MLRAEGWKVPGAGGGNPTALLLVGAKLSTLSGDIGEEAFFVAEVEAAGDGDLRFYFLSQIYPALMIPLICLLFPGRHTSGRYVLYLFVCYAFVVGSERLDHEIYALSAGVVSGHSLKHLFAALAAYMIHAMLAVSVGDPGR